MLVLTTRQEAALRAVLCSGKPTMADLLEIQNLQAKLETRAATRDHFNQMSRRSEEMNR